MANPEVENCLSCPLDDCNECYTSDYSVSREQELWNIRTLKIKAVKRLLRELEHIDRELGDILDSNKR